MKHYTQLCAAVLLKLPVPCEPMCEGLYFEYSPGEISTYALCYIGHALLSSGAKSQPTQLLLDHLINY